MDNGGNSITSSANAVSNKGKKTKQISIKQQ